MTKCRYYLKYGGRSNRVRRPFGGNIPMDMDFTTWRRLQQNSDYKSLPADLAELSEDVPLVKKLEDNPLPDIYQELRKNREPSSPLATEQNKVKTRSFWRDLLRLGKLATFRSPLATTMYGALNSSEPAYDSQGFLIDRYSGKRLDNWYNKEKLMKARAEHRNSLSQPILDGMIEYATGLANRNNSTPSDTTNLPSGYQFLGFMRENYNSPNRYRGVLRADDNAMGLILLNKPLDFVGDFPSITRENVLNSDTIPTAVDSIPYTTQSITPDSTKVATNTPSTKTPAVEKTDTTTDISRPTISTPTTNSNTASNKSTSKQTSTVSKPTTNVTDNEDTNSLSTKHVTSSKTEIPKNNSDYTVKRGDTLYGIAKKAGISLNTLYELNPDMENKKRHLMAGDKINLTRNIGPDHSVVKVTEKGDNRWSIAHRNGMSLSEFDKLNPNAKKRGVHIGDEYIVRKKNKYGGSIRRRLDSAGSLSY